MTANAFGCTEQSQAVLTHLTTTNQATAFCFMPLTDRLALVNGIITELDLTLNNDDLDFLVQGVMTDDFLFESFQFDKNHLDNNSSLDGVMFETYGEEFEYVKRVHKDCPSRVWTYQGHDESDCVVLTNEMVLSHCLGYLVTPQATPDISKLTFISDPF